ncbi:MAG TPA: Xaa-Pro peptidase family protein [Thermoanaerobaculia bacterium]|nr:Xaa-Pro peptidase family protein [Thermoanaerobaculia bacterium]
MLSDLDTLMSERGIDAVLVPMHEAMHASFRWLARGAKVTRGYAVKFAGRAPVLITYPMERDEAAASGLEVRLAHDFDHERIFRSAATTSEAYAEFFDRVLRELGGGGRSLAIFGHAPVHLYLGVAAGLRDRGWEIGPSNGEDLIQIARKRKEPWEVDAIASVGSRTEEVVDEVRAVLRDCTIDGEQLVYEGKPLKLGDLKELVSFEIARRGMAEDHETILSQGRDAGIPHSRGDANAVVRPSLPIVLDIFPLDRNSGYFFDLTRTFCVGPAGEELRRIHADVLAAFEMAARSMRPGTAASSYQALVCDYFESRGYATTRTHPSTLEGYVHSLGHGVGLDIHEKPFFSLLPSNRDQIEEGDIVTIEPGLYYPDRRIGVRIEDTFVVTADGVKSLCRSDRGLEP